MVTHTQPVLGMLSVQQCASKISSAISIGLLLKCLWQEFLCINWPIHFSFRSCWLSRAYLCLNGCSELVGRQRWTWETVGPVGWLRVQFEDHGILAWAVSAWQKVSSCLSRRGADSPVIVFRPPVSCLSSTCLCAGRKILLELKKSFNRNFFFPPGMFTEHFSRAKELSTKLM